LSPNFVSLQYAHIVVCERGTDAYVKSCQNEIDSWWTSFKRNKCGHVAESYWQSLAIS